MIPQIEARHLGLIRAILDARLPGSAVWVYGSRARGGARPHSDLDLLIDATIPIEERVLAQMDLDFADSDLPFRVEIVDGARLDPRFRQRVAPDLVALPMSDLQPANRP